MNETFKIHSGSRSNTDSAGCQTIHPDHYLAFIGAVTSSRQQTRWQYVLTSTQGGLFHNIDNSPDGPLALILLLWFFGVTFGMAGLAWRVMVLLPDEKD